MEIKANNLLINLKKKKSILSRAILPCGHFILNLKSPVVLYVLLLLTTNNTLLQHESTKKSPVTKDAFKLKLIVIFYLINTFLMIQKIT